MELCHGKRVLISESPGATLELTEDPDWTDGDTMQMLRLLFGPRPAVGSPEQGPQESAPGEADATPGSRT
jgi:hypothetical protein